MATSDSLNAAIANLQANIDTFKSTNQALFMQLTAAENQAASIRAQIEALPGFNDIRTAQRTIVRLQAMANNANAASISGQ